MKVGNIESMHKSPHKAKMVRIETNKKLYGEAIKRYDKVKNVLAVELALQQHKILGHFEGDVLKVTVPHISDIKKSNLGGSDTKYRRCNIEM